MSSIEGSSFLELNGYKVWFDKIGTGPNPILLIPGPIGTCKTDFDELLNDEDLNFDKFTIVSVDAPGYGRSQPPLRQYGVNVYDFDCQCFHSIMKELGYNKFTIIGFSDGAKVALLMSVKYPESVNSIALSAFSAYYSKNGLNALLSDQSVKNWKKDRLQSYLNAYETEDKVQKLWNRYIRFAQFYNQYFPEDFFKNKYNSIHCPVLLVHGDKDKYIEVDQIQAINKQMKNVRLHQFPNGEHGCHQRYASQFWKLVQDQILNYDKCNYQTRTVDILAQKIIGLD